MKQLKFTPKLCEQILSGEKTSTWRLFDDKDLQVGDELNFVNKQTGETIGKAIVNDLKIKTLSTLEGCDWEGHERYLSEEEMYQTYKKYYGNRVSPDSEVKIIDFSFEPT